MPRFNTSRRTLPAAARDSPAGNRVVVLPNNGFHVKAIRPWILVFLALLIPVRGAVAAAMLCPPVGLGMHGTAGVSAHPLGHTAALDGADGHQHPAHDHATHDHGTHEHGSPHHVSMGLEQPLDEKSDLHGDECGLCSAFCSVTTLIASVPTIQAPPVVELTVFPPLSAPAPAFFSDGLDRPPRSV